MEVGLFDGPYFQDKKKALQHPCRQHIIRKWVLSFRVSINGSVQHTNRIIYA
jgi:hypothetical protein